MLGLSLGEGPLEVLCLGAHPDDIEIGCGGTLLRLGRREGVRVTAMVLTGVPERVKETNEAMRSLVPDVRVECAELTDGRLPDVWGAVKEALEALATECRPDLVFAPRVDDAHQDHRLVAGLAGTVWRDAPVLHYEIPKWDGDLQPPTHYVALDEAQARRKVDVLNASFPSQVDRDWWDDELFLGLMRLRGVECRSRYAEGFFTSKLLLDPGESR